MLIRWLLYGLLFVVALTILLASVYSPSGSALPAVKPTMITGVTLVAPPEEVPFESLQPLTRINARWVAVVPYAFALPGKANLRFNVDRQWWGERLDGMAQTVSYAKRMGLKVMLKPHVWVRGEGWPGDFVLDSESNWQQWEHQYESYILSCLQAVDSLNVDMVCIGTEFRQATAQRPAFWQSLIRKIRTRYSGKLTYAANWDEFERIPFWNELDYIGIDAYFPLSDSKTPTVDELHNQWKGPLRKIAKVQRQCGKPVLFTEYGYQSIDHAAGEHWNIPYEQSEPNMEAQSRAFEALYQTFWHEPWFAGGFVWKWFCHHENAGGLLDKEHTPQNKPAEAIIRAWYGQAID